MCNEIEEVITGYDYKTIFEVVYEGVVTTDGLELGKVYKGLNVYIRHNKIDSMCYKVFINDVDKYNSIANESKCNTEDLKKAADKLAQELLNNFKWEAVSYDEIQK